MVHRCAKELGVFVVAEVCTVVASRFDYCVRGRHVCDVTRVVRTFHLRRSVIVVVCFEVRGQHASRSHTRACAAIALFQGRPCCID